MSERGLDLMQQGASPAERGTSNLADVLERVLDKGIVIAGDIRINLLEVELLTIKLRLLVASVDKAKEIVIDWWEHDRSLSSGDTPELELMSTMLGGMLYGWLAWRTGSIAWGAIAHVYVLTLVIAAAGATA